MSRRQAREFALQVLFQVDLGKAEPEAAMQHVSGEKLLSEGEHDFAKKIILGAIGQIKPIDEVVSSLSHDWQIKRMATVDRNILRLALYEIFYCEDIPTAVSVNEAVELAKLYGGEDSGRFINGILGKVVKNPAAFLPS